MSRLLLDTNVVLALLGQARLSAEAESALTDEANDVLMSAVVPWEIAIKSSVGKLTVSDGWPAVVDRLPFTPLPVTSRHAAAVEHLPHHHRDPFDRLLVAQAQLEECALVTADARLAAYGVEIVW